MIHVGVIGAGAWGNNLIRNVANSPLTELAAVCDPDEASRRRVASRYRGVVTLHGIDALLEMPGLDAIVVATPPHLHHIHAKAALEAGYHVLVEKPLCTTGRDARELVELADRKGLVLMVGHTFIYNNLVHEVKRRIDSGELGEVLYLYGQRLNLGKVRQDVDALWNLAPHDISIANYVLGARPVSVNARGACYVQRKRSLADVSFFEMDYPGGQMFSGHVSWLDPQKVRQMVVVGSERMLVYDDMDASRHIQVYDKRVELDFQSPQSDFADFSTRLRAGDLVIPNIRLQEPLGAEIEHFATCVQSGDRPVTDGRSGLELVCILEAMSRSMRERGALVEVDYQMSNVCATTTA
jgi:predicted dehydrogenase